MLTGRRRLEPIRNFGQVIGATTLSKTTLSITTFQHYNKNAAHSICDSLQSDTQNDNTQYSKKCNSQMSVIQHLKWLS
jgi:hypothetical protein